MTARREARRLNAVGSGTVNAIAERAARARVVLIGEASHGTQDFYAMRADVTRRLVTAHGFRAVALEADWPDTSRAHRYVTGRSDDATAMQALADFRRFPAWMWRNESVREFVDWLADFNRSVETSERAGLFGLDLYSLHASIEAVLAYLDQVDPAAAARARSRYSCFEYFGDSAQGLRLCGDAWCGIVRRRGRRSADRPAPAGACTDALRPLDLWAGWDEGEPLETWPSTL